jgi:hypothetical protein
MTELWRPIPGYEGIYDASNLGRLRSYWVPGGRHRLCRESRLLSERFPKSRYKRIVLTSRKGDRRSFLVHILLATTFHGPRPEGAEVRHLDGNSRNNHVDNLAWGTRLENMQDVARHGTHNNTRKTACPRGHPYDIVLPRGWRRCSECQRVAKARYRQKQAAA